MCLIANKTATAYYTMVCVKTPNNLFLNTVYCIFFYYCFHKSFTVIHCSIFVCE